MSTSSRTATAEHSPRSATAPRRRLMTMAETAEALRIDVKTLSRHVRAGEIEYLTIGAGLKRPRRRFSQDQIDRFVAGRSRAAKENCVLLAPPMTGRRWVKTPALRSFSR